MLTWIFYATLAQLVWMVKPWPKWTSPVSALEPFRIANRYGLFAVMTHGRYEIEFQGSEDGQTWLVYPFRLKPQDPSKAPRIYAPYQPRFDWNLWFASLSTWRQEPIVLRTEESLLRGDIDVLLLFSGNPFPHAPPRLVTKNVPEPCGGEDSNLDSTLPRWNASPMEELRSWSCPQPWNRGNEQ